MDALMGTWFKRFLTVKLSGFSHFGQMGGLYAVAMFSKANTPWGKGNFVD